MSDAISPSLVIAFATWLYVTSQAFAAEGPYDPVETDAEDGGQA